MRGGPKRHYVGLQVVGVRLAVYDCSQISAEGEDRDIVGPGGPLGAIEAFGGFDGVAGGFLELFVNCHSAGGTRDPPDDDAHRDTLRALRLPPSGGLVRWRVPIVMVVFYDVFQLWARYLWVIFFGFRQFSCFGRGFGAKMGGNGYYVCRTKILH